MNRKVDERRRYNLKHSDSPKKLGEYTGEDRDPLDSSENSTDEESRGLAGFFDRSRHILSHASVHLKTQVLPAYVT